MSGTIEYLSEDDDFDYDFQDAPKALRDHVKRVERALRETTEERNDFRSKYQTRSVNDVLADQKFKNPQRVARALLADQVDPENNKAVTKWLEENADDYAKLPVEPASESAPEAGEQQPLTNSTVSPETQSGYEAMNATTSGGTPAGQSKYEAAINEVEPTWTKEQVHAHFLKAGL